MGQGVGNIKIMNVANTPHPPIYVNIVGMVVGIGIRCYYLRVGVVCQTHELYTHRFE